MDEKTKGAWIIHHKNKLETVSGVQNDFDEIVLAGKCSQLLSGISSTQETVLDHDRVAALAAAVGISKRLELPNVMAELQKQRLINANQHGIAVLGLTSSTVLEYTSKIYDESQPNNYEQAVIELSEKASESPMLYDRAKEYISDTFRLDSPTADDVLDRGKKIGFFDSETTRDQKQLLFNGNLFRNTDVTRISRVLGALNGTETKQMQEVNTILDTSGCVPLEDVVKVTGTYLFNKLQSIGLYDVSSITNEVGECLFVTRPSSFCKFSSSAVDDAFDLAKAFVTSLTFGMLKSDSGRGRIRLIEVLILKKSTCFAGGQFLNGFACKNSLISFSLINGSVETSFKAPFGG